MAQRIVVGPHTVQHFGTDCMACACKTPPGRLLRVEMAPTGGITVPHVLRICTQCAKELALKLVTASR